MSANQSLDQHSKQPPKFISNEDLSSINRVPKRGDIEITNEEDPNVIGDEVIPSVGEQINIITPGRIGMGEFEYGNGLLGNDQHPRQHSHRKI